MYYFIVKERPGFESTILVYGCTSQGNGWFDGSVTSQHAYKYTDSYEAERTAKHVGGGVAKLSEEVYDWLVELRRLDREGGIV